MTVDTTNPIAPTSRWMAAARARESERADRLFDDPLAAAFAGPEGFARLALGCLRRLSSSPFLSYSSLRWHRLAQLCTGPLTLV